MNAISAVIIFKSFSYCSVYATNAFCKLRDHVTITKTMTIFETIILSIIEGITEFLPISSTGHLIIASDILGIAPTDFLSSFTIAIQLGAILAIVVLYGKKFLVERELWKNITIAFLPTAVIGVLLFPYIKKYLLHNELVGIIGILLGGIVLILVELFLKKRKIVKEEEINRRKALAIGLFQASAFVPGISRSAATIIGGLLLGVSRKTIVEFSFFLAIPTMVAATGYDLIKTGAQFSYHEWWLLVLGALVSFVVAVFTIKILLRFIEKFTFIPFGVYRIIFGLVFLGLFIF